MWCSEGWSGKWLTVTDCVWCRGWHRGGRGTREQVLRVGSEALEVVAYLVFEFFEGLGLDVDVPLKVTQHFPLHLIEVPQSEHTTANDHP